MGNRTDFCIDLFAFTIHSPAWETTPISASICSPSTRSPAWNRTDFCTSDHLGITHGRKTVSPLRNPCDSESFWSQLTIDVRLHENQFLYASTIEHGRHLSLSFISTAEHRVTRAVLERHHARVTSELFWSEVFTSVFFFKCLFGFTWFVLLISYNKYPPTSAPLLYMTPIYTSTFTTVQYRTFTDPLL